MYNMVGTGQLVPTILFRNTFFESDKQKAFLPSISYTLGCYLKNVH